MPFKTISDCCKQPFLYEELYKGWCLMCSYNRMKSLEKELRKARRGISRKKV